MGSDVAPGWRAFAAALALADEGKQARYDDQRPQIDDIMKMR